MLDLKEIDWAIGELEKAETSYVNCMRLASLYTIRNQYKPTSTNTIDTRVNSEFLQAVQGKPYPATLEVINELMDSLQVISPKIYEEMLEKLQRL